MNILLPNIETLESITKVKINDTAEEVKATYKYLTLSKQKTKLNIDESKDQSIIFSFADPKGRVLNSTEYSFFNIETFISCLGSIGAKFTIGNILDDNNKNKILLVYFVVQRNPIEK